MKIRQRLFKDDKTILLFIFCLFIIVGMVIAGVSGVGETDKITVISQYFLTKYEYKQIDHSELAVYIVMQRLPVLICILIFGFTSFAKQFMSLVMAWFGFSFGYLHYLAVMRYGIKGFALMTGLLFPQYLIYIPTIWYLMRIMIHKEGKQRMDFLLAILILSIVYILGILLENYVNPFILYQIIKIL